MTSKSLACAFAFLLFVGLASVSSAAGESAFASERSATSARSAGLETPESLRPRVNFWKDIFTKYGKYQLVIHHRRFPQIVFKVIDFSKAAENLSYSQLESLKKRVEQQKVTEIQGYLQNLSRTGEPSNSMEEYIVRQMDFLPGGTAKYQDAITNDWVRTQTGIKERYEIAVQRTGRYLPGMERIFAREYNLPVELTRLPFVESSFDYTAYSSVGAAGIWQFMRGTAKKMMTINAFVDERLDPFIATRAAAQYLQKAYSSLGTWPLAITSYNHGVAGVYRKVQSSGTSNLASMIEKPDGEPVFGFASSNFFPEFLASVEIYENYLHYFPGLHLLPELRVKEYRVSKPIYIQQVARTLGVDKDDLLAANYALLPPVASGRRVIPAGYVLRVPFEAHLDIEKLDTIKPQVNAASPEEKGESASSIYGGVTYTVRKGDSVLSIAKKYQMTVDQLRSLNGLKGNAIKVGMKMKVHSTANVSPKAPSIKVQPKTAVKKPAPIVSSKPKVKPAKKAAKAKKKK